MVIICCLSAGRVAYGCYYLLVHDHSVTLVMCCCCIVVLCRPCYVISLSCVVFTLSHSCRIALPPKVAEWNGWVTIANSLTISRGKGVTWWWLVCVAETAAGQLWPFIGSKERGKGSGGLLGDLAPPLPPIHP
jgi:hypothetical protein